MSKIFNFPLKTFDEQSLMSDMMSAKENDVYIIGEREVGYGKIEVVIANIKLIQYDQELSDMFQPSQIEQEEK